MIGSFYIAWRYLTFNKVRTATLIACVTLIAVVPLALQLLLAESERQLLSRAQSTPLLLGARGSALDLVMNSLYFSDEVPQAITMAATGQDDVAASAWKPEGIYRTWSPWLIRACTSSDASLTTRMHPCDAGVSGTLYAPWMAMP